MIQVGDILRVVFSWIVDNTDLVQQVWHYYVDSGNPEDPDTTLDDIVTEHETAWATALDSAMPNNVVGTLAELYVWNPSTENFDGIASTSHGMDGATTNAMTAQGVCGLAKFHTSVGRYQGRKYVGPLQYNVIEDTGALSTGFQTALSVWGALLAVELRTTELALLPGTFNRVTHAFHEFTGPVSVAAVPAYQRRRRDGQGA